MDPGDKPATSNRFGNQGMGLVKVQRGGVHNPGFLTDGGDDLFGYEGSGVKDQIRLLYALLSFDGQQLRISRACPDKIYLTFTCDHRASFLLRFFLMPDSKEHSEIGFVSVAQRAVHIIP
jgi:hypothetical protein